ncbi:hypothetical protein ACBJ59_04835 [Nonomuraea sp. MTCD27]|uniref:hypothetical protein n=1 Tax=Nonomuraea sp. MTCD27 TaxID=1676747 RepID=UPI0035BFB188
MTVDEIVSSLRGRAAEQAAPRNPLASLAASGHLGIGHVRRLLAGERAVQDNEIAAFATLVGRFPRDPAVGFFLSLASVVNATRPALLRAERALGESGHVPETDVHAAGAHAFSGYLCWLAMRASLSGAALALYTNLLAWCGSCGRLAAALRNLPDVPPEVTSYLASYEVAPPDLLDTALAVARQGAAEGECPQRAEREAGLVLGYLDLFWQSASVHSS